MGWNIVLLIFSIAFVIGGIPATAIFGGAIGAFFHRDGAPVGALFGYIVGIVLWAGALVLGIFQIVFIIQAIHS